MKTKMTLAQYKIESNASFKVPRGTKRSSRWPTFRKNYFKKYGKRCELCGSTKRVQLHHINPFHKDRAGELQEENVIALCEDWRDGLNCHLAFGHLGSFKSWNENVREDVKKWRERIESRPK